MTATVTTLTGPARRRAINAVKAVAGVNGRKAGRLLDRDEPIVDLNPTVAPDTLIADTVSDYVHGTVSPHVVAAIVSADLPTVGEPDAHVTVHDDTISVHLTLRGETARVTTSMRSPQTATVTGLRAIDVPGGIAAVPTFLPDVADEPGKAASAIVRAVLIARAFDQLERLIFDEQANVVTATRQGDLPDHFVASVASMDNSWRQMPDEVQQFLVDDPQAASALLDRLLDRLRATTPLEDLFI